jgi:hypothetical protein
MLDLADRLGTKYQILHPKADCLVATVGAIVTTPRERGADARPGPKLRARSPCLCWWPFAQARARISPGPLRNQIAVCAFLFGFGGMGITGIPFPIRKPPRLSAGGCERGGFPVIRLS